MAETSSKSIDPNTLDRMALEYGIEPMRPTPDGRNVRISDATKRKLLRSLNVDLETDIADKAGAQKGHLAATGTAGTCFVPRVLSDERLWGVSLQLYELRSRRNWGIGDFEDLKSMIDLVASLGGDFIGLNPLHAPFLADASRCSPYEPSSRLFLNPLYLAIDKVSGFEPAFVSQETISALRETDLVEYEAVATTKLSCLRAIWERRKQGEHASHDLADFRSFVRDGGERLRLHALFEALSAHMAQSGCSAGWQAWPKQYHHPDTAEVRSFAADHTDDIEFHLWLQWLTHVQLMEVAAYAKTSGLKIGLYLDLAVGEALDGSATWSEREAYLTDATIGSPPDPFAPDGQDWHLAGLQPSRVASGPQPPFERMVGAAMRYAGAIRIDHVAALRRLYIVPVDGTPSEGAYVSYPQEELIRILAETSARHRCLVVGEDLGLLPEGLQDDLAAAKILSYRILSYEHDDAGFKPAADYPALALVCISTHDHQTLAGWWQGLDIDQRREHGIVSPNLTKQHAADREKERQQLASAIGAPDTETAAHARSQSVLDDLTIRAHRFIAGTPSILAAVRLADLTDEKRPTNVPGTSSSYPNWRPKLSVSLENLSVLPLVGSISDAMNSGRRAMSPEGATSRSQRNTLQTQVEIEDRADVVKLDAIVETYSHKMPRPLGRFIRWLRTPNLRWLRLIAGILLVLFGFVGFLPILGFWMVPLGLIILAQDTKWLQRPTLRAIYWLERKFGR